MNYNQKSAKNLIATLVELSEQKRKLDWKFCNFLHTAYNGIVSMGHSEVPLWKFAGRDSWDQFVQVDLKISSARALKYIRVYETFKDQEDQVAEVEVQRLELALPIVNNYNISKIVSDAKTMTQKEFKSLVAPQRREADDFVNMSFRVPAEDEELVNKAIFEMAARFGHTNRGNSLVEICKAYLAKAETPKKTRKAA